MGKRIFRLDAKEAFSKSKELLNRELNFVMIDGRVHLGLLKKAEQEIFYCENMFKNPFQVKLKDLNEVIYDMKSNF